MWDNHTMSREAVVTKADLGRRIADARAEPGMTQADLAAGLGLERTALVRIESGERKVSATELVPRPPMFALSVRRVLGDMLAAHGLRG
jgi:DNA-binding XRE family transcriptional regulator